MKRVLRRTSEAAAILLISLCVIEVGLRSLFAFKAGPKVLLYGSESYNNDTAVKGAVRKQLAIEEHGRFGHHWGAVNRYRDVTQKFPSTVGGTTDYYKYMPRSNLTFKVKGSSDPRSDDKSYQTTLNNYGFRGSDFEIEKPEGTFRILTLGASSTFGYSSKDN